MTIVPPPSRRNAAPPASKPVVPARFRRTGLIALAVAAVFAGVQPAAAQAPGSLDALNASVVGEFVRTVATQPDGKIILAGKFTSVLGVARKNIARLNADGTLDTSFDVGTNDWVYCLSVQPDGKIIIGGHFTTLKPAGTTTEAARGYIARLNANGTLDTSFDVNTNLDVTNIARQPDGRLIISGYFTSVKPAGAGQPAVPRFYIARLTEAGALDLPSTFVPLDYIYCTAIQEDGKILVGGKFLNPGAFFLVRLNPDLTRDLAFNPVFNGTVNCIAVQRDGRIVMGGAFTGVQGVGAGTPTARNRMVRLSSAGAVDTAFNPNVNGFVECLAIQTDNRIILGGSFTSLQPNNAIAATERLYVARVNADGSLDSTFNPKADNDVTGITLQNDGMALVSGYFTKFSANSGRNRFGRLNNSAVTQTITNPSTTKLAWERSGALQDVDQVQFETSTDGGTAWNLLGAGGRNATVPTNWEITTPAPLPTSFLVRARGRTTAGSRGSSIVETAARFGLTAREEWNITWFGSSASTGNADPTADPNNNGIPNLMEYALGGDPAGTTTGTAVLPVATADAVTGALNLAFTRYPGRNDITITVQAASDVNGPWEDAVKSTAGAAFTNVTLGYVVTESGAGATRSVTCTDKMASIAGRRFMRLKVTNP